MVLILVFRSTAVRMVRGYRSSRRSFLCPATLLPMLMLALSINQMILPLEAAR